MKGVFSKMVAVGVLFATAAAVGSCNVEDDDDLYATGTIKHAGIDWSDNASVPTDWSNADGETIGWCEIGTPVQGVTGIWYRVNDQNPVIYNLGNVDLASVTSFDASLAETDICDTPMAVGDVWVANCHDGYVKFKVTSVDDGVNSVDWAVGVEYEFSTNTQFPK